MLQFRVTILVNNSAFKNAVKRNNNKATIIFIRPVISQTNNNQDGSFCCLYKTNNV